MKRTKKDLGPYSNYRMAVRLELTPKTGLFAQVALALAEEGANLGGVDIVSATKKKVIRDITFDANSEEHGQRVLQRLRAIPDVHILFSSDRIFMMHLGGKIRVDSRFQITTRNTLSMAYTPGVGRVAQRIAEDPSTVYSFTTKGNTVAVVTDGSAVLGLGNLGPEAALPVMEGKVMLFHQFAGINAWPICLNTQNPDDIVKIVSALSTGFGGINLEDISAPRCFEIERQLQDTLDIPVMHDDQHGTAVVILAALTNALKLTKRHLEKVKIVVNGLGAAGTACCQMLLAAGAKHLVGCDKKGIVLSGTAEDLQKARHTLPSTIQYDRPTGTLQDALKGAHVFIGLSQGNILKPDDLDLMAKQAIVFALANPDPEISPDLAIQHCRIFASGRSDYPNQCNNLLAFPGIFRGALDVHARCINEEMKLAAADALAHVVPQTALHDEYIIPSVFDRQVVSKIAKAVAQAAHQTKVARRTPKHTGELEI